jgi:hemerythrin-like domain-containing protein
MFQDHHELDDRLKSVQATKNCSEARRLLKATIASAREHFRMEEEALFPFVEKTLAPESLEELGRYWVERNAEAIGTPWTEFFMAIAGVDVGKRDCRG